MNQYKIKCPKNDAVKRFTIRDNDGKILGLVSVRENSVGLIGTIRLEPTKVSDKNEEKVW